MLTVCKVKCIQYSHLTALYMIIIPGSGKTIIKLPFEFSLSFYKILPQNFLDIAPLRNVKDIPMALSAYTDSEIMEHCASM